MNPKRPSLSFCITCKNRLHQIRRTLRKNLEDNRDGEDTIDFVLVDFGSTDGLQTWLEKNFADDIQSGYLHCYYTDELSHWHASVAKNTAHLLAKNEIVVNLDCDNYTGLQGGKFVIDNMLKYGFPIIHQFSNQLGDGSFGRIAVKKKEFLKMGGYDDSLGPYGAEDIDFVQRLWVKGNTYIHLPDKKYNKAIINTKEEGVANLDTDMNWWQLVQQSRSMSYKNITSGRIIANKEQGHIGIMRGIYKVIVTDKDYN